MQQKEETIIMPNNEVKPWPFTEFAKILDNTLKDKRFDLQSREYVPFDKKEKEIFISRNYKDSYRYGSLIYTKGIHIQDDGSTSTGYIYPEHITWINGMPKIQNDLVLSTLKHDEGWEKVAISHSNLADRVDFYIHPRWSFQVGGNLEDKKYSKHVINTHGTKSKKIEEKGELNYRSKTYDIENIISKIIDIATYTRK